MEPFIAAPDAPGYYAKIAHPIDLTTILLRALNGYYRSPAAARADVALLRATCATFNPEGHPILAAALDIARTLTAALQDDDGSAAAAAQQPPPTSADPGPAGADAAAASNPAGGMM